ncbi:MAG: lipase [Planctomycetota bacterium]
MQLPYRYLPPRITFWPSTRLRRRLRAAAVSLMISLGLGLGVTACAVFGGQSGRLMPNLACPTLGGTEFWSDVAWDAGWKVQRHAWTGHARLLDPKGVRRAWGAEGACRAALAARRAVGQGAAEPAASGSASATSPAGAPLVVLLHGLGRSHRSFAALEERLHAEGYEVLAFEYASTRGTISEHAAALAGLLEGLAAPREVSFVTHSLGGIVLRELTRDAAAPWRARHTLGRAVTLAAPHGGAEIAARLSRCAPVRWVLGPAFVALGDGAAAALPEPDLEFGAVVAVRGDGRGWNPWVAGDDDGLVAATEATLPGAREVLFVEALHTFVMNEPRVLDAVVEFLRVGAFGSALASDT